MQIRHSVIAALLLCSAITPTFAAHRGTSLAVAPPLVNPLTQLAYATGIPAVYTGCATPPAIGSGNIYYSDPAASSEGSGTALSPFRSLSNMIADGIFAQDTLHSGPHIVGSHTNDTVYLEAGDHGTVIFHGWDGVSGGLTNFDFPTFVTIAGDPTVVDPKTILVHQIHTYAGKIVFHGFKVESINTSGNYMTPSGNFEYWWLIQNDKYSHDIVFDGLTVRSAPTATTATWTMMNWQTMRGSGFSDGGSTTCTAFTNNTVENVGFGISAADSDKELISKNTINRYVDDGLDWGSSHMWIVNNTFTNNLDDADGFHKDMLQGQPANNGGGDTILIESNTGITLTDMSEIITCDGTNWFNCPGEQQGLDNFDGAFSNLTIRNNVTIPMSGAALTFKGLQTASITNNIALGGKLYFARCGVNDDNPANCTSSAQIITSVPTGEEPGFGLDRSKAGVASSSITTTGNDVGEFTLENLTQGWTTSSNRCIPAINSRCFIDAPTGAAGAISGTPTYNAGTGAFTATLTANASFSNGNPVSLTQVTGIMTGFTGSYDTSAKTITITCPATCAFKDFKNITLSGLTGSGGGLSAMNGTWVQASHSGTTMVLDGPDPSPGAATITNGSASSYVLNDEFNDFWTASSVSGANIVLATTTGLAISSLASGGVVGGPYVSGITPGTYAFQGIVIEPSGPSSYYKTFDTANQLFDLRPGP